jgi:uncharacterized protein (TIRG00374 family)
MKIKTLAKVLVSAAIVVFLLLFAKLDRVSAAAATMDPYLLALAAFLVVPMLLVSFVKWQLLLRSSDIKIPFIESRRIYLIGIFFSLITPSKIGTLIKFYYLKKDHGTPSGLAFSLSLMDKMFDVVVVVIAGAAGILLFSGPGHALSEVPIIVGIAFVAVFLSLFLSRGAFMKVMTPLIARMGFAAKFLSVKKLDAKQAASDIYAPFGTLKRKPAHLLGVIFFLLLFWVFYGMQMILLAASLGTYISPLTAFLAVCTGTLIGLIPVTIGGIGTRDATLVYIMSIIGISMENGILISLLLFALTQVVMALLGGIAYAASGKKEKI